MLTNSSWHVNKKDKNTCITNSNLFTPNFRHNFAYMNAINIKFFVKVFLQLMCFLYRHSFKDQFFEASCFFLNHHCNKHQQQTEIAFAKFIVVWFGLFGFYGPLNYFRSYGAEKEARRGATFPCETRHFIPSYPEIVWKHV